ncbi:hypothetical protein T492DRAFT_843662 [Pavlovales sp. CCMP2436]|nr:hypothetical protein T492DRAFT_843662 [Pavlovales sp. CCMP2436]
MPRRELCAGLACVPALLIPRASSAKTTEASSRIALLNTLAHLVLVKERIRKLQAALDPSQATSSQRVLANAQCKALFKELEFERNMEGAIIAVLSSVPGAKTLGRDSLEFLGSVVTFDGLDDFTQMTNARLISRETTPAKLDYVRRAVAKSATSLDQFLSLFDDALVQQATQLAQESGIS